MRSGPVGRSAGYFLGEKIRDTRPGVARRSVPEQFRRKDRKALVEAPCWKGRWVYVGLGGENCLPACRAYQLLANLISFK
jgi:hypothetical protein